MGELIEFTSRAQDLPEEDVECVMYEGACEHYPYASPPDVTYWVCACGGEFFTLHQTGIRCGKCGNVQDYPEF